jgi:hypothetical protein
MKWSFLASLLTSAAVLAPISASAKAETSFSAELASARIISGRLVSKFSALGSNKKKDGGDSQQAAQTEGQGTGLNMDKLGRGGNEAGKAKSPDTLQLSRGLGSGAEGGGSPSQHAPVVKTKDMSLPGRPMLANQQVTPNDISVNGEKGPSLASTSSRSADNTFVMPTPVTITVGQDHQSETRGGTSTGASFGHVAHRPQSQDITSPSSSQGSEGFLGESHSSSIELGGSGGGGGGGSSSQEGTVLPPEAVQEYRELRAKAKNIPPIPSKPNPFTKRSEGVDYGDGITSETLARARTGLKNVAQSKSTISTKETLSPESSLKTVSSSSRIDKVGSSVVGKLKASGRSLSGNIALPEGILRAAEALGFDPSAQYKDEREALDELRKKASGKASATEKALDKVYGSIVGNPTSTQLQEIERLSQENESIEAYRKTLIEYLKKRSYVYPSEEALIAAGALGFEPSAQYKDEREALDELRKKASGKASATEKALDKVYGSIVGTPTSTQLQEIERLSQENDSIEAHRKTLIEYLKKRYAASTPSKGRRIIQVSGEGKEAMFAAIASMGQGTQNVGTPGKKAASKKVLSLKELGQNLTNLDKKIMTARMSRDMARGDDEAVQELDRQLIALGKDKEKMQSLYEETREKENLAKSGSQSTASVKVDPQKALKDQETLRLFKEGNPSLVSLIETLSSDDQVKLLNRKVTVLYNPQTNKHILEPIKMKGIVIQGATKEVRENVVDILKKLSPKQLNDFREFVAKLGKGDQVSAFDIPNIMRIAQYKFPDMVPVVIPTSSQKKVVVKVGATEGEQAPKKTASTTVKPKVEPVKQISLKERMELLKGQSMSGGKYRARLPLSGSGTNDKDTDNN